MFSDLNIFAEKWSKIAAANKFFFLTFFLLHLFTPFKCLFAPNSKSPMSNLFWFSESLGTTNGKKQSQMFLTISKTHSDNIKCQEVRQGTTVSKKHFLGQPRGLDGGKWLKANFSSLLNVCIEPRPPRLAGVSPRSEACRAPVDSVLMTRPELNELRKPDTCGGRDCGGAETRQPDCADCGAAAGRREDSVVA